MILKLTILSINDWLQENDTQIDKLQQQRRELEDIIRKLEEENRFKTFNLPLHTFKKKNCI